MPYRLSGSVAILGDCGVGKTSLVCRYLDRDQAEKSKPIHPTVGADYRYCIVGNVKLGLWDICGATCSRVYAPQSNIVLLVYSVTDKKTFDNLDYWLEFCRPGPGSTIWIVGTHCDVLDKIQVTEIKADLWAQERNIKSVRINDNVKLFEMMSAEIERLALLQPEPISLPFLIKV